MPSAANSVHSELNFRHVSALSPALFRTGAESSGGPDTSSPVEDEEEEEK